MKPFQFAVNTFVNLVHALFAVMVIMALVHDTINPNLGTMSARFIENRGGWYGIGFAITGAALGGLLTAYILESKGMPVTRDTWLSILADIRLGWATGVLTVVFCTIAGVPL